MKESENQTGCKDWDLETNYYARFMKDSREAAAQRSRCNARGSSGINYQIHAGHLTTCKTMKLTDNGVRSAKPIEWIDWTTGPKAF